ncbi:MAG: hypothetical protein Q8R04_04565 [Nanoarchaeota archaeon]|nr:hypothetical protein [Nanoarchaeota archaeon]
MTYYRDLIIAASIVGSVIGHHYRDDIRNNNLLMWYLPQNIQQKASGSVGAASGYLTGAALMKVLLEYARKRETDENGN